MVTEKVHRQSLQGEPATDQGRAENVHDLPGYTQHEAAALSPEFLPQQSDLFEHLVGTLPPSPCVSEDHLPDRPVN